MKFLLVGCGSIGVRHLRNLKVIMPDSSFDVYDSDSKLVNLTSSIYSARPADHDSIDCTKYDLVLICTPPVSHVDLAIRALKAGSSVFIEKPLSSNFHGLEKLKSLAKAKELAIFVGYNFRFNKGVNALKRIIAEGDYGRVLHISAYFGQYLPDWRPYQNYKKNYTSRRDLGGGIILDGSHEIDYLAWLLGTPISVQSQFKNTDILATDTEAITDVLLEFRDDILGYIHLDFVRREYKRRIEVLSENGILEWSMQEATLKTFNLSDKKWHVSSLGDSPNDMYLLELRHVIECIKSNRTSEVIGLENGISSFRLSSLIYESGVLGQKITVL